MIIIYSLFDKVVNVEIMGNIIPGGATNININALSDIR